MSLTTNLKNLSNAHGVSGAEGPVRLPVVGVPVARDPIFLEGDYLRGSEPDKSPTQHNTWVVHVDLTWNILCVDRRRQAVFAKT